MTIQKIQSGRIGENAAAAFLKHEGYRVLARNFRNGLGEIDIVAQDGDTLCFIEVKTRDSDIFGSPFEAVTPAKQRKMAQVAAGYLKFKGKSDAKARFDVVAVMLDGERCQSIEIIRNAFEVN